MKREKEMNRLQKDRKIGKWERVNIGWDSKEDVQIMKPIRKTY